MNKRIKIESFLRLSYLRWSKGKVIDHKHRTPAYLFADQARMIKRLGDRIDYE